MQVSEAHTEWHIVLPLKLHSNNLDIDQKEKQNDKLVFHWLCRII